MTFILRCCSKLKSYEVESAWSAFRGFGDLSGRTGLPPVGWSSAKASARLLGDHAAMPGSAAGGRDTSSEGHDRFGQCNGRLVKVGGHAV